MSKSVIAVFDLGRHHKHLYLFDRRYEVVKHERTATESTTDEDGHPCENLESLTEWIRESAKKVVRSREYRVRAINFTSYGSAMVHTDAQGKPLFPLYDGTKPLPAGIAESLYDRYGGQAQFMRQTATPSLGMYSSGLQLYWLKQAHPKAFKKVKYSLHLPQYASFLLGNEAYSEITSLGCHTALWDFQANMPHRWVFEEKLHRVLPPLVSSAATKETTLWLNPFQCGIGMHDSSAALLPYLIEFSNNFTLLETGTCNVALCPQVFAPLTEQDMASGCLQYLANETRPIRAARVHLQAQYERLTNRLARHFGKAPDYHHTVTFDEALASKLRRENRAEKRYRIEQDPLTRQPVRLDDTLLYLNAFDSFEEAYHQLNIHLVALQAHALKLAMGQAQVERLFVSGPFGENSVFMRLLADQFPQMDTYTAPAVKASALGAALMLHARWNPDYTTDDVLPLASVKPERHGPLRGPEPRPRLHQRDNFLFSR